MDNEAGINEKLYVSFNQAKRLAALGFNERTSNAFVKGYHLSDAIRKKYPGLSDDGYYDLAYFEKKEKPSTVYPNSWYITGQSNRNCFLKDDYANAYSMPTLEEASNWLFREKSIIAEYFYDFERNGFRWQAGNLNKGVKKTGRRIFTSREKALSKAINEALKML